MARRFMLMRDAPAPRSYAELVLEDSPIAYWRLEEPSGTSFADSSGNSRTATSTGTVTPGSISEQQRLGSYAFFESGGYLSVSDSSPFRIAGDLTCELWWRKNVLITTGGIIRLFFCVAPNETEAVNALYQWEIRHVNSTTYEWRADHENGAGNNNPVSANYSVDLHPLGLWQQLVLRRNTSAKTYEYFINGVRVGTAQTYAENPTGGTSAIFHFSRSNATGDTSNRAMDCDELAIYSSALSDARILEHYRAGRRRAV